MNISYLYYSALLISKIFILIILFTKDIKTKTKLLYFVIGFLSFGMIGLIIKTVLYFNYINDNIFTIILSLILSLIFSIIISKSLVKNLSDSVIISNHIKKHESLVYVGLIGKCETKITKVGGVVILNDNKRISAITYDKTINKNDRVLITDYNEIDDVYIVDYYPI